MPQEEDEALQDKEDLKRAPIKEEELEQFMGRMSLR